MWDGINEISNSSDLVWDLAVEYERGADWEDIAERAATLSTSDRALLMEEIVNIDTKCARDTEYDAIINPAPKVPRAGCNTHTGFCWEGAILGRDECDSSWWT